MPFDETPREGNGKGWRWWNRDEPEAGLQGFVTREDRDRFSSGGPGPFRRVVALEGERTVPQMPPKR
jgi:hypothetical protein